MLLCCHKDKPKWQVKRNLGKVRGKSEWPASLLSYPATGYLSNIHCMPDKTNGNVLIPVMTPV